MLMEVCDQPELGPGYVVFVVSCYESKDIFMSEHHSLIDLGLPEPGLLVPAGEDLHRHVLSSPQPSPHLTIATLPHTLGQRHLAW